jgi:hypothetical protein
MSILSNELFNTPITYENVRMACGSRGGKPYQFYKKGGYISDIIEGSLCGSSYRVYYAGEQDIYLDIHFYLFEDKLVVRRFLTINNLSFIDYTHEIDCVEALLMIMDEYFDKYKILGSHNCG